MDYQISLVLSYDSNEEIREISQFNYVENNIASDIFNGVNKQKIIIKNVNDIKLENLNKITLKINKSNENFIEHLINLEVKEYTNLEKYHISYEYQKNMEKNILDFNYIWIYFP